METCSLTCLSHTLLSTEQFSFFINIFLPFARLSSTFLTPCFLFISPRSQYVLFIPRVRPSLIIPHLCRERPFSEEIEDSDYEQNYVDNKQ